MFSEENTRDSIARDLESYRQAEAQGFGWRTSPMLEELVEYHGKKVAMETVIKKGGRLLQETAMTDVAFIPSLHLPDKEEGKLLSLPSGR